MLLYPAWSTLPQGNFVGLNANLPPLLLSFYNMRACFYYLRHIVYYFKVTFETPRFITILISADSDAFAFPDNTVLGSELCITPRAVWVSNRRDAAYSCFYVVIL